MDKMLGFKTLIEYLYEAVAVPWYWNIHKRFWDESLLIKATKRLQTRRLFISKYVRLVDMTWTGVSKADYCTRTVSSNYVSLDHLWTHL